MIILEQGVNARDINNLDLAKELFEECLQMRITSLGDNHLLVAEALVELGQVYRLKGSFTRARECYEVALKIFVHVSDNENGKCNKDIALTHRRIGLAYKEENTWVLAFGSLQKSIEMYSSSQSGLSTDSLELASTLYEAAHVAIRLSADVAGGGLDSAVGMLSRSLEIREKRLGRFHRDTHQVKLDLAVKLRIIAKNVAMIGKHAYFRNHAIGGMRFDQEQEEYVQIVAPAGDSSYDSSLAIILLESAAESFEQVNINAESSGNRDSYNLRELANVYVELGRILIEEQLWIKAAAVYEKLLDTYRHIYCRGTGNRNNERDHIGEKQVLDLLDENADRVLINPLLEKDSSEQIRSHQESSNKIITRMFHTDNIDIATALATAAFVCMRCNRLKRAKELYMEAIEIYQRIGQDQSLAIADIHSNFGELREREKKFNKAKEQHELAYTIRLKLVGDDHPLVADSLEELGHLRLHALKCEKAERDFAEVVRIRRGYCMRLRRTGSGAVRVPNNYSSVEKRVFAQATWEAELAEADNRLCYGLCDYAFVFGKKKNYLRAKELLEEALAIRKNIKLVFNDIAYSAAIVQLATILIECDTFEKTRGLLNEALRIREEYFGMDHKLVVEVLCLLATVLDKLDEINDAQRMLQRALDILIRIQHTDNTEDVAQTYSKLGMLFFKSGNYPISITHFKKALQIWMKLKGIESTEVTDAMLNLAFAFKKNDEVRESRDHYEQAAAILRRLHGYNHSDVASVLASLSSLSFYEKKFEEALDYSKQVLRIRKRLYGRDNVDVINTSANQAVIYEKLMMNKNAHKLHSKVLLWREQHLCPEDILIAFSLIAMSDSFRRLGMLH